MRSVGVEMLQVLAQYDVEVAWSGDQEVVEAFPSQGADEAFGDRVRPWCPDRGADDPQVGAGEDGVERSGDLLSRSRIRNRNCSAQSPRFINRLRACWVTLWGSRTRPRLLISGFRTRTRTG